MTKHRPKIHLVRPIRFIITDGHRHLVCLPYSLGNLHMAARQISLGRHWFHKNHYDVPVNRRVEIESACLIVSSKVIVRLVRQQEILPLMRKTRKHLENENDPEVKMHKKFVSEGKEKVHYCPDWDFMAIHEGSPEFEACCCDH